MTSKTSPSAAQGTEEVAAHVAQGLENIVKVGQDQATRHLEQAVTFSRDQLDLTGQLMTKRLEDMATIGRLQLEAMLSCSQLAAKTISAVCKEIDGINRNAVDKGVAAATKLLEARSFEEAFTVQADYFKSSFDDALASSTRLSEIVVRITDEVVEPLKAQALEPVLQNNRRQAA